MRVVTYKVVAGNGFYNNLALSINKRAGECKVSENSTIREHHDAQLPLYNIIYSYSDRVQQSLHIEAFFE